MLVSPYNKPKIIPPQSIRAIGGGDMRFTLNGIPIPSEKTDHRECGWGKVIISPRSAACEHHFRVRMEIMDAKL